MAEDDEPADDFKYIVRIANTDLDGNRPTALALTSIKGVGPRIARILADLLELPRDDKVGNLTDEQVEELGELLETLSDRVPRWLLNRREDYWSGEDEQLVGPEVEMRRREDINRLKMIRSYRGIRHEGGHKVRGQRTRSNGRTGLTVGVTRRAKRAAIEGAEE